MSEQINNRAYRKQVIKELIKELHEGKTVDEVKGKFAMAFEGVSASEISEAEQALISEGLPVDEVQRLCDVHASVFKGSIEEIHAADDVSTVPGHPAYILRQENRVIEDIIKEKVMPALQKNNAILTDEALQALSVIDIHYSKKENLMFPYLEKYGITAPPQVMWGVDDEIRDELKDIRKEISRGVLSSKVIISRIEKLCEKIIEMIFKEENILLPMVIDLLTEDEWKTIYHDSFDIGFLIDKVPAWNPVRDRKIAISEEITESDTISLPTGVFKLKELECMLNTLPFDITFVDKECNVKFFSQAKDRIFARTKSVIGRKVSNCHPPASVHIVEKIVEDLKNGVKDNEDFWIKMGEKFIFIRYIAVRDENGEYLGVVEVTQDIAPIQDITGEKRLMS